MRKNQIDLITLGCSKNLIDSERVMYLLQEAGYNVVHDSDKPEGAIAVINTCGFIGDAKEESINMILNFCERKKEGRLQKLYVMGCLSERYREQLREEIPEVDAFYGKFDYPGLVKDLGRPMSAGLCYERTLTTPPHYAYVRIAEGCYRHCSYCVIPLITGKYKSRPIEDILNETKWLVSQGVKEFQLIAQDLTYYGIDIYSKSKIAELVNRMADIEGVEWIRLHYAYPAGFPRDLLTVMKTRDNVCKYLDLAFQHISDHMLTLMRRGITTGQTYELIDSIRAEVPGIYLRTTLMVGHPGETEEDFEELLDFVRRVRFERMGAFAYSDEENSYSNLHYEDDVPEEVKQSRLDKLMSVQQEISLQHNASLEGNDFKVIIDRKEGDYYVARTQYDSPEVDMEVLIEAKQSGKLAVGGFYDVKITKAEEFDLYGVVL